MHRPITVSSIYGKYLKHPGTIGQVQESSSHTIKKAPSLLSNIISKGFPQFLLSMYIIVPGDPRNCT